MGRMRDSEARRTRFTPLAPGGSVLGLFGRLSLSLSTSPFLLLSLEDWKVENRAVPRSLQSSQLRLPAASTHLWCPLSFDPRASVWPGRHLDPGFKPFLNIGPRHRKLFLPPVSESSGRRRFPRWSCFPVSGFFPCGTSLRGTWARRCGVWIR